MDVALAREVDPAERRRILEMLTARLPEWFGQPSANRRYAGQAERLEGWTARLDAQAVGLLLLARHSPVSAEIHWLGVDPGRHRRGIGRTMADAVERQLRAEGLRYLFVMTLHPDDPYEPYRRTRLFYERLGFELVLAPGPVPDPPSSDRLAWYLKLL